MKNLCTFQLEFLDLALHFSVGIYIILKAVDKFNKNP